MGLFSLKLSSQFDPNQQNDDHDRLKAVIKYLTKEAPIGSIDKPDVWVADKANVKIVLLEENKQVVFFSGITDAGTIFGLGGSTLHTVGQPTSPNFRIGWSFLPYLLGTLQVYDKLLEREKENLFTSNAFIESAAKKEEHEWMDLIQTVQKHTKAPTIHVEFLAKRLLSGTHPNTGARGVLATPIYVRQLS